MPSVAVSMRSTMTHMDILAKLFGSSSRVKLMRLFLMNPEDTFDKIEMTKRSKVSGATLSKEIKILLDVGLIKQRVVVKMKQRKDGKDGPLEKRKVSGYGMDSNFPFLAALRSLVTEIALGKEDVSARFRNCGQMKLIIVAGIFLDETNSRADILLVGDKMKKPVIEGVLRRLEAELGKELTYAMMETAEFEYRFGIYDKFVRDIIDYPHLVVLNKLNLF
ncbi:MAG: polymerase subunit beta protein [Parcubacteria group bacterium GW2011_GWA2_47_7]|nr:MAG: polymerase subunit beta protein [Parcubacteria group bacterium GW2011_GWA2_47_7]